MVQIIGLLICFAVAIKLLEMVSNSSLRDETGKMRTGADFAIYAGWLGVVAFAVWLIVQGQQFPGAQSVSYEPEMSAAQQDCIMKAKTDDEVLAC